MYMRQPPLLIASSVIFPRGNGGAVQSRVATTTSVSPRCGNPRGKNKPWLIGYQKLPNLLGLIPGI